MVPTYVTSALEGLITDADPYDLDPVYLPVETASLEFWDQIDEPVRQRILGGMLRNLLKRSTTQVPYFRENPHWQSLTENQIDEIHDITDLQELPVMAKDSLPGTGSPNARGVRGFRDAVVADPYWLVPDDLNQLIRKQEHTNPRHQQILEHYGGQRVLEFGSGGSQGQPAKTILSYLTIEMEAYANVRCFWKNGFRAGQSIACFYAPHHKGGLQLERAADIMDMEFHSKHCIFEALAEHPGYREAIQGFNSALDANDQDKIDHFAPTVREGIRDYIRRYQIQVIESVQPPTRFIADNAKGNALAFMTIYEEDPAAFASVEHVFLTGFPVPQTAYDRLRADGKQVSTTWGSTEVMALGTYPQTSDSPNVNDLHAAHFPTVGLVGRVTDRPSVFPHPEQLPVGTRGFLFLTGLIGVGSTYINYVIGDLATRTSYGFQNIDRVDVDQDISGSCADDALSLPSGNGAEA